MKKLLAICTICVIVLPTFGQDPPSFTIEAKKALKQIKIKDLQKHTTVLSSDEFQGREPGTEGGRLTTSYIVSVLEEYGIDPGVNDTSYLQHVEVVSHKINGKIDIQHPNGEIKLKTPNSTLIIGDSSLNESQIKGNELIFIGDGSNLSGNSIILSDKIVMCIYSSGVSAMMIMQDLKSRGAKSLFFVWDTSLINEPYTFEIMSNYMWGYSYVKGLGTNLVYPITTVWVDKVTALEILQNNEYVYEDELNKFTDNTFEFLNLKCEIQGSLIEESTSAISHNIIGRVEGEDEGFKDEYVVYTAHWDHLGIKPDGGQDSIYNGAADNASGTASLLNVARAFNSVETKRSQLFVFTTKEEGGLLGSKYFVNNPVVPLNKIIANINIDGVSNFGTTKDIVIIGSGYSSIDDIATAVATDLGKYIIDDPWPELNYYEGADHFSFAEKGIPAFYSSGGLDDVRKGKEYGKKMNDDYTENHYHQPSDEINHSWRWDGVKSDSEFFFLLGYLLSNEPTKPYWKESCPYPDFHKRWLELQDDH